MLDPTLFLRTDLYSKTTPTANPPSLSLLKSLFTDALDHSQESENKDELLNETKDLNTSNSFSAFSSSLKKVAQWDAEENGNRLGLGILQAVSIGIVSVLGLELVH